MMIVSLAWLLAAGMGGSKTAAAAAAANECRYQPSFNCALADDEISRQICVKPDLIALDCMLGYAYRDARKLAGDEIVKKGQISWVTARKQQCEKASRSDISSCIRSTTLNRLRVLITHYRLPAAGKVYEPFTGIKPEPRPSAADPR
jgi:uncharacterized protein YecT (DUF1311 family)